MLRFKVDIMELLKHKGITTTEIRNKKLIGENALQDIRNGIVPGTKSIDKLCGVLKKQPGQILEWIPDTEPGPAATFMDPPKEPEKIDIID